MSNDIDMTLVNRFRVLGEVMGLKGKPLTQYIQSSVEKQFERERAERERRAKRERKEQQAERERDERERQAEWERECEKEQRATAERIELAKLQANKDLELAKLEVEVERARERRRGGPSSKRDSSTGLTV